ncbi:intradiol ring-cleavage dioxygenase [Rhodocytophaga rosea]|uniref:Intradiol ring-cleavage dioxygenase n=1 Tax=Rhodocytophaga rosea TaxID=2704465 RepID=A0A6C0GPA6_9BACT|nr:intradiol ring-cleavage dioxygenase [Rhodocytophaga rosea]QHT69879.1 intradiol ring-cleavage dioxygenase [Rhodocytophaga rosea]
MHTIVNLLIFLILLPFSFLNCNGQTNNLSASDKPAKDESKEIGGAFENAEFMDIGMPEVIDAVDTSTGWAQNGQKLLITGIIYTSDGKQPASNVLLYYYHTNTEGRYLHQSDEKRSMPPNNLGQTHGYIRGWVKSDKNGRYSIYTVKPGTYPTRDEPAHIHVTIKEPHLKNSYYIDDFVFDEDELLTSEERKKMVNRGGSGILRVVQQGNLQIAEHNIILGLNIPNYPKAKNNTIQSGLQIGEEQPSFIPYHAFGPDKGSRTCPVCKYGRYHGIIYFVGNNPNWADIKKWLIFLEQESMAREKYLKVYFVYGNQVGFTKQARQKELEKLGNELNLKNIALTFVPSMRDTESEANLNKINPEVENTFVVYRHRIIIDKYINLKPTLENFKLLSSILDTTQSEYFNLPTPGHE